MSRFIVYGLVDPRNNELFYIGKSCAGLDKAKRHRRPESLRRGGNEEKCRLIAEIIAAGFTDGPIVIVLEECRSKRQVMERETIAIRAMRHMLVNKQQVRRKNESTEDQSDDA